MMKLPRSWDYKLRFVDTFHLPFLKHTISVKQSPKGSRVGCTVWDAAIVVCKYFELMERKSRGFLAGKRVIELGAGTGILGLAAALLGAKVTLTDIPLMIEILNQNIMLNRRVIVTSNITTKVLSWGEDISEFNPPVDYIIGSDLMYDDDYVEALVDTICSLSDRNTQIYLGYETRQMNAESKFMSYATQHLDVIEIISAKDLDPSFSELFINILKMAKKKRKTSSLPRKKKEKRQ